MNLNRRDWLRLTSSAGATALLGQSAWSADPSASVMRLGLVTYNWGQNWDAPTLIRNCADTGFEGVELRTTHQHGVEIALDKAQREEVRKRFADSSVTLVGLGTACEYHSPDPVVVAKNIEETKQFIQLCKDVGGSGVKVRPNGLPPEVPVAKTLEQIGKSLNEVARFGADHGIAIRLEVHGKGTAEIPNITRIMQVADHPNAVLCWNCNATDLAGPGLKANFEPLQQRIGTVHIHDLRTDVYPWPELFALLKAAKFRGWTLLEEGKMPDDIIAAMRENRDLWETLAG